MCEMLFCNQNVASVVNVTILLNVTFLTATPLQQRVQRLIKSSQQIHVHFIELNPQRTIWEELLCILFTGCNNGCEGSLTLGK